MHIINLTATQYMNYANIHNTKSFGQTYEYSNLLENKLFLGLTDESNNIYAAVLLMINNISPSIKEAYAKDGFIIDYNNLSLVKTFTNELKKYLKKLKITYLTTNPKFKLRSYDKHNNIIENNTYILNNLLSLGYKPNGYTDDFSKYNVIIEKTNAINIYHTFNRNTKRNIKDSMNMGITLHKGNSNDIEKFNRLITQQTNKNISYYYNLMNTYNTKNNKMDIFFTKLDPKRFLPTAKKLYEKELKKNEKIYKYIAKNNGKMDDKTLNKKINSDTLLEKYKELLNKAIHFSRNFQESIIVGTCATLRNKNEIHFLIDGYNEQYRSIHSNHLLKWAIIKKYSLIKYNKFNLGEIHKDYNNKDNKYYGQYQYKIGFGGNIIEYPQNLILIINKTTYKIFELLNKFKKKSK